MRRVILVLSAAMAAVAMSAFGTAWAQTSDQYASRGGEVGSEDASQDGSREASVAKAPPPVPENLGEPTREGLDQRVLNDVAENPYSRIVDNATRGRFSAPGGRTVKDASAYDGSFVRLGDGRNSDARFKVGVPETGYYTVYARWPQAASNTTDARIGVSTADGMRWDSLDQTTDGTEWVTVGPFELEKGAKRAIVVSPGKGGDTAADAVAISENVLVGANAQMASVGDPDLLTPSAGSGDSEVSGRNTMKERRSVVRAAKSFLGRPYDYDYQRCRRGMSRVDCSCFTRLVFLRFDKRLPDSPVYQWKHGRKVSYADTRRGDLVFQDLNKDGDLRDHYRDHVSIWSGNGYVVHASSYFGKVVETKQRYLPKYWGTKRLRIK